MRGVACQLEAREAPRLVAPEGQRANFSGKRLAEGELRRFHRDLAQLVECRQTLREEQPHANAGRSGAASSGMCATGSMRTDMPCSERSHAFRAAAKVVARVEAGMEGFRLLLDAREIVRPALQHLAHLVDRQPGAGQRGCAPLAGQERGEIREPRILLAVGAIELDHARCRVRRRFGHLDQFLVAREFAGKQRIGEDLLQRGERAAALALQLVQVDLVDRRQLEKQLDRQRALVALDQVQIGRRDAESLGHRRLGQAKPVADAADARTREDLLFSHRLQDLYKKRDHAILLQFLHIYSAALSRP